MYLSYAAIVLWAIRLFDSCLVVGYTTQDHLLIDLDNCNFPIAKIICSKIQNDFPHLGDCLIVRSSPRHYHLIFDDFITWSELCHIIEILADLGIVQRAYQQVRTFRRDLTLRVSQKKGVDRVRPVPEPCCIVRVKHQCNFHHGMNKYYGMLKIFNNSLQPFYQYGKNQ